MGDTIDRAEIENQRHLERALKKQRGHKPELAAIGECHYCREPLDNDRQKFCDSDCAIDYERLKHQRAQKI